MEFVFGISEIVMGCIHMRNCPAQVRIPIYLLVAGIVGVSRSVANSVRSMQMQEDSRRQHVQEVEVSSSTPLIQRTTETLSSRRLWKLLTHLLAVFALLWVICGLVWTYGTQPQFNNRTEANFCQKEVYSFAKAMSVIRTIILCVYFSVTCFCVGFLADFGSRRVDTGDRMPLQSPPPSYRSV
ncbi:hypothetical protein BOX15_Mlig013665g3 [Macrostomum lignano]|nr:hypothetical protein BOX15_Mlig013665g3 [Macrostomum lignano]